MQGAWYKGKKDGQPELMNQMLVDKLTAWNAVQSITTALYSRQCGDARGQRLEIAMLDVGLAAFWPDSGSISGAAMASEDWQMQPGARYSSQKMMKTKDEQFVLYMM